MLFMRYGEEVERELHVPLGPLYLNRALEDAGFGVDFRDDQCVASNEPFDLNVFMEFLRDPAPVIGLSCMANLLAFCEELVRRRLDVKWKAFGRINLVDREMMQAMARTGCVELRFGIESGSDRVLAEIRKGFRAGETIAVVSEAVEIFPRVDCFLRVGISF